MTTNELDPALRWLAEKQGAMEADLAELVELNSFTENVAGGRLVAERLVQLLRPAGLTVQRVLSQSGRFAEHLVFRGKAVGPPMLLVGHYDTVFPPGTFEGYRREGALARGPGVLDMKGGLVVVAYAVRALAEQGLLEDVPVGIVVVSDEEVGSPEGAQVLRDEVQRSRPQAGLVFEAGRAGDAVITARKGAASLHVVATGRAAHAGNAHAEGVNAIWALACFIDEVQRLTRYDLGRTVNVGKVRGGQTKNTVPDAAEAWVDVRFTTQADAQSLDAAIRAAAARATAEVPGAQLAVDELAFRPPLERSAASQALAAAYGRCAVAEGLGFAEAPRVGGGSDANTLSALHVATIDGLGPRGQGFHTLDEHIEVASLVPKARALARFLAEQGGAEGVSK